MKYNETRENSLGENSQGQFTKGGGEFDQVGIHRGGFHIKCAPWKIFEQIGIGMSYLHVFLIEMRGIDTAVGAYACMLELFCENS